MRPRLLQRSPLPHQRPRPGAVQWARPVDHQDLTDQVRFELVAALGPTGPMDVDVRADEGRITLSGT
ncbi:hypothetical protein VR45_35895, partial [Streptomyces sp. NRRL S-495]